MRLLPVLYRLRDTDLCPLLRVVEPAYSMQAIQDQATQTPAVFIHPIQSSSEPEADAWSIAIQQERSRFGLLIAAQNMDLDTGREPLEDVRDEIRTALLGYQPTGWQYPLVHLTGQVVDITKDLIWWRDVWAVSDQRRAV